MFRFSSPYLTTEDRKVYECPVGKVLRESPRLYEVIKIASMLEHTSAVEYSNLPLYVQQAGQLYSSEINRCLETRRNAAGMGQQAAADAQVRKNG